MAEQDNELPDRHSDKPETIKMLWTMGINGRRELSHVVDSIEHACMYRKDGVAPDELDTDLSRGLLLDRIKELEEQVSALQEQTPEK